MYNVIMRGLSIFIVLFFTSRAYALLTFEDATIPEIVTSARALAQGNAFISKVDDSWSSFYNPAGLGSLRGVRFQPMNLHMETSNGLLDVLGGSGSFINSTGNYSKAFDGATLMNLSRQKPGRQTHARLQYFPNISVRGLTLGYVYARQTRTRLNDATSNFEYATRLDTGPVMALNISLFGGIFKVGASAMVLTRTQTIKDFLPSESFSINGATDTTKATTTLLTLGTRLTLPVFLLPTFSAVVRNSSQSSWYAAKEAGAPADIRQTLDLGVSLTPFTSRDSRLHLEVNYRDFNKSYESVAAQRRLLVGMEFDIARTLFFRLGYGDGWGSGGIGVARGSFSFDLTTYAVELGDGYRQQEDRRTVLSFSKGFN